MDFNGNVAKFTEFGCLAGTDGDGGRARANKKIFRPLLGKNNGGRTVGEKGAVLATTDVS